MVVTADREFVKYKIIVAIVKVGKSFHYNKAREHKLDYKMNVTSIIYLLVGGGGSMWRYNLCFIDNL